LLTRFWWGKLKERVYLEDLGVVGRLLLSRILKMGCEGMDWVNLAEGRNKLLSVKNRVIIIYGNETNKCT
jgi:hypothetical protein